MEIKKAASPLDHIAVALLIEEIARSYRDEGRFENALTNYKEALVIFKQNTYTDAHTQQHKWYLQKFGRK